MPHCPDARAGRAAYCDADPVDPVARSPAQRLVIRHEGHLPLAVARWADPLRRAVFVAVDDAMLQTLAAAVPAFPPDRQCLNCRPGTVRPMIDHDRRAL
jgi:hypothetical protein